MIGSYTSAFPPDSPLLLHAAIAINVPKGQGLIACLFLDISKWSWQHCYESKEVKTTTALAGCSVVRPPAHTPKDHRFDSSQGYVPGLQIPSLVPADWSAWGRQPMGVSYWCFSPPLPSILAKIMGKISSDNDLKKWEKENAKLFTSWYHYHGSCQHVNSRPLRPNLLALGLVLHQLPLQSAIISVV